MAQSYPTFQRQYSTEVKEHTLLYLEVASVITIIVGCSRALWALLLTALESGIVLGPQSDNCVIHHSQMVTRNVCTDYTMCTNW